ncbi:MAG: hypothetical protein LBC82_09980 [Oscillospiraceae bacterium]|jgi:hypothetical protein|nr:hypothetical protein [Oscillospiraceae bacterium]
MQKSVIKQLFESNSENLKITDPKYDEISDNLSEVKENFLNSLSESDREIFESIEDLECKINFIYDFEHFALGFIIGVALKTETLSRKQ